MRSPWAIPGVREGSGARFLSRLDGISAPRLVTFTTTQGHSMKLRAVLALSALAVLPIISACEDTTKQGPGTGQTTINPLTSDGGWLVPQEIKPGVYTATVRDDESNGLIRTCRDTRCADVIEELVIPFQRLVSIPAETAAVVVVNLDLIP